MPSLRDYTIVIRPDTNGTYVAHVPAIAGCHAYGLTAEEAHKELENVFDMIRDEFEEAGISLPKDCRLEIAHAG